MRRGEQLRLTCVLLLLAVASAAGAQESSKNTDAAAELRRKTFEKTWEIVRDKFYDPTFNGIDWNKARERYAPLAGAAKNDAELYAVLKEMLSELKVSHMGLITPDELKQSGASPVTTGLRLRTVEGRV